MKWGIRNLRIQLCIPARCSRGRMERAAGSVESIFINSDELLHLHGVRSIDAADDRGSKCSSWQVSAAL